ncbi:MAG: energy-coupling factor ABC transporter ATP-binding protein [Deltaproteobacteria bacterium]|nr:energy-coupling factor ABC transporter ATP-binding protein [Deltaproteobacteria bacterium]
MAEPISLFQWLCRRIEGTGLKPSIRKSFPREPMGISLSFDNLSFTYRGAEKPAIERIRGDIKEGAFVVIMGHGGAGKSSLCCTANGLIPRFFRGDYRGRVLTQGIEAAGAGVGVSDLSRIVGLVMQDFEVQLFSSNVELEMAFGPENLGLSRERIGELLDRYLPFVGLGGMNRRDTATLSGGQKQRLAIGAVLTMETPVLILDEPTTDLDPRGRSDILSLAADLKDSRRTLVMADNDAETAADASRIWLMRQGVLIAQGPPEQLLADPGLLQSCGVKPPPTVTLFESLGWPGRPLTPEEAISEIRNRNLISPRRDGKSAPPPRAASRGGPAILETQDLCFRYPGSSVNALDHIDLAIREGEFVALIGQNGSGKTTLAKHFNGLLKPTSGRLFVDGKPASSFTRHQLARQVGYVFQNPDHQIFAPTVREEVGFGLKVLGEPSKVIERNVEEALAATGLAGYGERSPFLLSRGERQRVAVASVLAIKPPVIVLDEPTTGLDDRHQQDSLEMLRNLNRQGHTIIIITHAMAVAEAFASRTIVMKEGRLLANGPTRDVFSEEALLAKAALIPSPLARLSNRLGLAALTLPEMVEELKA